MSPPGTHHLFVLLFGLLVVASSIQCADSSDKSGDNSPHWAGSLLDKILRPKLSSLLGDKGELIEKVLSIFRSVVNVGDIVRHLIKPSSRTGLDLGVEEESALSSRASLRNGRARKRDQEDDEPDEDGDQEDEEEEADSDDTSEEEHEHEHDQDEDADADEEESVEAKESKSQECHGYTCKFQEKCGKAPLNELVAKRKVRKIGSYMINGEAQNYGEWPSFVRIQIVRGALRSNCGGVVISDRHILTAAHCMYSGEVVKPDQIILRLGEHRLKSEDPHEKKFAVKSVCVSKQYEDRVLLSESKRRNSTSKVMKRATNARADDGTDEESKKPDADKNEKGAKEKEEEKEENEDDIDKEIKALFEQDEGEVDTKYDYAVLTIKDKIPFNDHYQPACLPPADFVTQTGDANSPICYLVGSGSIGYRRNSGHQLATTVQRMRVQVASCEAYGFGHFDESRECYTKHETIGDSCAGDSGGPILCLDPKRNRWTVAALVSYGSEFCDGSKPIGWVGVYTRITNLMPKIKRDCGI